MAGFMERTGSPIRKLTAEDLGVGGEAMREHGSNRPDDLPLADDHPLYLEVLGLLERFGGIVLTGPPGTSKSYYAAKIGTKLAEGDQSRIAFVQFHPSYQYEDFMQGYVPKLNGDGFEMQPKYFVRMCVEAGSRPKEMFVLVIDELSRGDPGRVFGEALTYVEKSKRGLLFHLASGQVCSVPKNLVILATMNPLDRGVDEVDAAFERRFAKIAMNPDRSILAEILERNELPEYLRTRTINFFNKVNGFATTNPHAAVGHTYFADVVDEASLRSVWDHQLSFLIEKAYRLNPELREDLEASFTQIFEPPPAEVAEPPEESDPDEDVVVTPPTQG